MTNDTTPATDEQIATYKKRLEPYVNGDLTITYPLLPDESKSLIARIEQLQADIVELKRLLGHSDSYLSLLRHRYIRTDTPDDLRQDVDQVIGAIRNASKGEL